MTVHSPLEAKVTVRHDAQPKGGIRYRAGLFESLHPQEL